jgi:hypothetical protein
VGEPEVSVVGLQGVKSHHATPFSARAMDYVVHDVRWRECELIAPHLQPLVWVTPITLARLRPVSDETGFGRVSGTDRYLHVSCRVHRNVVPDLSPKLWVW